MDLVPPNFAWPFRHADAEAIVALRVERSQCSASVRLYEDRPMLNDILNMLSDCLSSMSLTRKVTERTSNM